MSLSSQENEFLSSAESLTSLPMHQASEILHTIESRVAYLRLRSRATLGSFHGNMAGTQARELLDAERHGILTHPPTIQDLERHAPEFESIIPPEPKMRAALALLIGDKYLFTHRSIPHLRLVLGLDGDEVKQAFQQHYGQDITTIYAPEIGQRDRILWAWSTLANRLENLPPFWTVFALTLTETVGATVLALPIALASVGPIVGIIQLVVLGLVNILTIAALCEAITRNGSMRYGNNFFGHLVNETLGQAGLILFTPALLSMILMVTLVYYVGVATTLASATGIASPLWAGLMLVVQLYFLRRGTISSTIASAMIVGAVNIGLILIIALLALPHVRAENLTYINFPLMNEKSFDPSILSLIFGTILAAYFGHFSSTTCARLVLRRDPSGRSLIGGAVAAMAVSMVLYCLFVIVVNGSISPMRLAGESGTVLTPLAEEIGPIIFLFGTVLVILGMGMASIHFAFALFNQVREWLPPSRQSMRWLGLAPIVGIFIIVEWLLLTNQQSFSAPISFLGTLSVPLLSGIFPLALLASTRRQGDYVPKPVPRWLGHPILIALLYAVFLGTIFLHAFVIWQDARRFFALVAGIAVIVATILWFRRGSFKPRVVIELRMNGKRAANGAFNVTADGKPALVNVVLKNRNGEQRVTGPSGETKGVNELRTVTLQLAVKNMRELKVWVHCLTPENLSTGLAAHVQVCGENIDQQWEVTPDGKAILPIHETALEVKIDLADEQK